MAEAFLNEFAADWFEVASAGTSLATRINHLAVIAMQELGIDISKNEPKSLLHFLPSTRPFDYIITLCDPEEDLHCPAFSDRTKKLHWSIKNPNLKSGSYDEKLDYMRKVRDQILENIKEFIEMVKKTNF